MTGPRCIDVQGACRVFPRHAESVVALADVTFSVPRGAFVAVTGPSGSGKSTLLHLLGGLDRPTAGEVVVDGHRLADLDEAELAAFRRRRLGVVFQFFNLLPYLSAWENVALPLLLDGRSTRAARARAEHLLAEVGLGHRSHHRPGELSGGEMQRVAIARALVADPSLVLGDEPTGNLSSSQGQQILDLLVGISREGGRTLVLVTHDPLVATAADAVIEMKDGRLVHQGAVGGGGAAPTTRVARAPEP